MIITTNASLQAGDNIRAGITTSESGSQYMAVSLGHELLLLINDKDQALELAGKLLAAAEKWEVEP